MAKIGQNTPCPCGSGKKYKQCCLHLREAAVFMLNQHWSRTKVATLTTSEIMARLHAFGIPIDIERFTREAPRFHSAEELSKHWWKSYPVTAHGFDQDFPWMACRELWERLLPDIMNSERLDELMQEGYSAMENDDRQRACTLWLKVWEHLKPRFTPAICSVEEAEQVFDGQQLLSNWCQDIEMELGNAGLIDPRFNQA